MEGTREAARNVVIHHDFLNGCNSENYLLVGSCFAGEAVDVMDKRIVVTF